MDMTDGYEILKTILFETGHGIALGDAEGTGRFAVWNFTQTAYGRDYYRESFPENRHAAEDVFRIRADRYRGLYGVKEQTESCATKYYRYYSTQRPVDIATFPKPDGNHHEIRDFCTGGANTGGECPAAPSPTQGRIWQAAVPY